MYHLHNFGSDIEDLNILNRDIDLLQHRVIIVNHAQDNSFSIGSRIFGNVDTYNDDAMKTFMMSEKLLYNEEVAKMYSDIGAKCNASGDTEKAKKYWLNALDLYKQIGIPHKIEKLQSWLDSLDSP